MDYIYTNLLTASDMRRILQQRELKLPNIDELDDEELQKIFNNFIVPMERRDDRRLKRDLPNDKNQLISSLKRALPPPVNECATKLSKVTLNVNVQETSVIKRKTETNGIGTSVACKRKKITWP